MSELPEAIAERETTIGGYRLRLITLDTGKRVVLAEDMDAFVHALNAGLLTADHARQAMAFVRGIH
ncbi:putative RNA-binding protein associated with RNAse of E/G family [Methylobacterium sp. RAS18]|nr:putative RNA-binding protein associated with RNAse of E/G family [Methylobacterium sp. RAS18]